MVHAPNKLSQPLLRPLGRAVRPFFVGASSLAIAGLLGACASPSSGPSPAVGAQAKSSLDSLPVIGPLKNAESAFAEYARARQRESGLRETVQAASDAALVARHRQSIGSTDFLVAAAAESRLATARRELRMGEAATRAARSRLYRALGINDNGMAQVSLPTDHTNLDTNPGAALLPPAGAPAPAAPAMPL